MEVGTLCQTVLPPKQSQFIVRLATHKNPDSQHCINPLGNTLKLSVCWLKVNHVHGHTPIQLLEPEMWALHKIQQL